MSNNAGTAVTVEGEESVSPYRKELELKGGEELRFETGWDEIIELKVGGTALVMQ